MQRTENVVLSVQSMPRNDKNKIREQKLVMCNFAEFRSLRHDHNFVTITTSSDVQLRCGRELRLKNYFVRENHFVRIFMKLMESLQWFIPRQNGCH